MKFYLICLYTTPICLCLHQDINCRMSLLLLHYASVSRPVPFKDTKEQHLAYRAFALIRKTVVNNKIRWKLYRRYKLYGLIILIRNLFKLTRDIANTRSFYANHSRKQFRRKFVFSILY